MNGAKYRVLNWDSVVAGTGVNRATTAALHAYAKRNNPQSPYLVANEHVAGRIAEFLCLPVPPHCVADRDEVTYFLSLSFNLTGEELPPAFPDEIVAHFPKEAAGIVIFDIYIANFDRHSRNLAAVTHSSPPRLSMFDHDRSLLGMVAGNGEKHLAQAAGSIVIDGSPGFGNRHCLLDVIPDGGLLDVWVERVRGIPDWYLENAAEEAQQYGQITAREAAALGAFLKRRRELLGRLLGDAVARGAFPGLQQRGMIYE